MTEITFYPLGNADCCLIKTGTGKVIAFDFADMHVPTDKFDRRLPLAANFKQDIGWPERKEVDLLAITHGDNDHIKGISDTFWLEHAIKYQSSERIKIKEMWVPAALICDSEAEDDCKILRAEAQHRFLSKKGIRVFARPEHLKEWVERRGRKLDDFRDIITDAGRLVPGWSKESQGIEFFVHSPFAEHTSDGLLDRNGNCLVMQATILEGGVNTRFLITADSVWENWQKMVSITKKHGNEEKLAWDIFKIPHHGSYLSMAPEKGDYITTPTDEFKWLLEQGTERSVMVSSSWEVIMADDPDDVQPPHAQTHRRYQKTAEEKDSELVITMENPSKSQPKRTLIEVTTAGATLKKIAVSAAALITSTQAPRVG